MFIELVQSFGVPVALIIFFVHKNAKREERQEEKFTALEEFCRNQLVEINRESISANVECSEALKKNAEALEENAEALKENTKIVQQFKAFLEVKGDN